MNQDEVRKEPCSSCPYRKDVPSGVWAAHEYDKLVEYDKPTAEQPPVPFGCHATPEYYCYGWAVVHSNRGHDRELFALRVYAPGVEIPEPAVPLFSSGAEAAEHGKADIEEPSVEAKAVARRLVRKYDRLNSE
jgi:hypothetical protein